MTFGVLTVVQVIVLGILAAIGAAAHSRVLMLASGVLGTIVWILVGVLWIVLMIQAGTGKMWKLPWAGDWAERQANKGS
ncbi:MAG: hypothetical protein U9Q17_01205 [Chloroflexota bacterium]|nr:hypothetical protein [Chloroflexota bacterium]